MSITRVELLEKYFQRPWRLSDRDGEVDDGTLR